MEEENFKLLNNETHSPRVRVLLVHEEESRGLFGTVGVGEGTGLGNKFQGLLEAQHVNSDC